MKRRPKVLLADDHVMVSEGLKMLLEDTCEVIGSVTDGCALVEATKRLEPDEKRLSALQKEGLAPSDPNWLATLDDLGTFYANFI